MVISDKSVRMESVLGMLGWAWYDTSETPYARKSFIYLLISPSLKSAMGKGV